ncbi:unnamed protein product [Cunninghamella echinulata]
MVSSPTHSVQSITSTIITTTTRESGIVKFFNATKGYGFILPNDQIESPNIEEVFVHHTAIHNDGGFKSLNEGQEVEYDLLKGPKGMQALNVTGPGGIPIQSSNYAKKNGIYHNYQIRNGYHYQHHLQQQQQQHIYYNNIPFYQFQPYNIPSPYTFYPQQPNYIPGYVYTPIPHHPHHVNNNNTNNNTTSSSPTITTNSITTTPTSTPSSSSSSDNNTNNTNNNNNNSNNNNNNTDEASYHLQNTSYYPPPTMIHYPPHYPPPHSSSSTNSNSIPNYQYQHHHHHLSSSYIYPMVPLHPPPPLPSTSPTLSNNNEV